MTNRLTAHRLTSLADPATGLITRSSVTDAGFDRSVWHRAVARGDLVEVVRGAAVLPGAAITDAVKIAATVVIAGTGAMASHRSAAHLWGVFPTGSRPVDVIRLSGGLLRDADRFHIRTHRPADAAAIVPVLRAGVPCTPPARTLIDVAAVVPERAFDMLVEMRIAGLVTVAEVEEQLERRPVNAPGTRAARDALVRQLRSERPPDSVLEARFMTLVERFGLPPMAFQVQVLDYRVDFLVIGTRVIVECDGFAFHGRDPRRVEADRLRDAALTRAGYRVVRVTWSMVTTQPQVVVDTIRAAVGDSR
jgi:very-short-patch-repair endonuclease